MIDYDLLIRSIAYGIGDAIPTSGSEADEARLEAIAAALRRGWDSAEPTPTGLIGRRFYVAAIPEQVYTCRAYEAHEDMSYLLGEDDAGRLSFHKLSDARLL